MALETATGVQPVAIYGAGGHGRVVADIFGLDRHYAIAGFIDDRDALQGLSVMGHLVWGGWDTAWTSLVGFSDLFVAIGENDIRAEVANRAANAGFDFATAIHPSAQIGSGVEIGPGTVVMPNVVINAGAQIGRHVIVNTAATIDHDCEVGSYSHISPGVHLGGGVRVGERSHLGIGASAIPRVRIGPRTVIGAGSTVIRDVPSDVTAVGSPAKVIKRRKVSR